MARRHFFPVQEVRVLEVINTEQSTIANANYPELSPASAASNLAEAINTVLPDEKSPLSAAARTAFSEPWQVT